MTRKKRMNTDFFLLRRRKADEYRLATDLHKLTQMNTGVTKC
jgi:hypothetical protein